MVKFINGDLASGSLALGTRISAELRANKRVLWLLSGGSNIIATLMAFHNIPDDLTAAIAMIPMDERFGEPGHTNSNVQQLIDAGFKPKGAMLYPILHGGSIEETTQAYNATLTDLFYENDVIIGQFGIGEDGHTAGILPGSPATFEADQLAISYKAHDFERITATFAALRRISIAYGFAYGVSKQKALLVLKDKALPLDTQPAQILKELPECYVYNDQI